jgi:hypothetical protein
MPRVASVSDRQMAWRSGTAHRAGVLESSSRCGARWWVGHSVVCRPVPGVAAEAGLDGPEHRHVGGCELADDGLDPGAARLSPLMALRSDAISHRARPRMCFLKCLRNFMALFRDENPARRMRAGRTGTGLEGVSPGRRCGRDARRTPWPSPGTHGCKCRRSQ